MPFLSIKSIIPSFFCGNAIIKKYYLNKNKLGKKLGFLDKAKK